MILYAVQALFKASDSLNEIDIINHVHVLKKIAKTLNITGLLTFRADMFAIYAEGGLEQMTQLEEHIQANFKLMHMDKARILSRKYNGKYMHYVGDDVPVVNDPLIDWGISDPEIVFPYELIRKIFEINRSQ
jgi:acylphosphatase